MHVDVASAVHALYGNPTFDGPYNPATGSVEYITQVRGRDGELTNDHAYLSAVVLLHRRENAQDAVDQWLDSNRARLDADFTDRMKRAVAVLEGVNALDLPDGDYFFVDVIHTTSARTGGAPLLSSDFFDRPRDRHWVANPDGSHSLASR